MITRKRTVEAYKRWFGNVKIRDSHVSSVKSLVRHFWRMRTGNVVHLRKRKTTQSGKTLISMKQQMLLLLVGLSILPILVMGVITYGKAQEAVRTAQESMLSAHAQGIRNSLESTLGGVEDTLTGLASQSTLLILMEDVNQDGIVNDRSLMNSTAFSLKNAVKGSDKLYESAFIAGKSGEVLVEGTLAKTSMVGTQIQDRDYYQKIASKEKFAVGTPFPSKTTGRLVVPMAKSIETLAGWSGTLVVLFDHQRLMESLDAAQIGKTGAIYILDPENIAVYDPEPEKTMTPLTVDIFKGETPEKNQPRMKGFGEYRDLTGARLAAWEPLSAANWTVVATLSRAEFEKGILQIRHFMIGIVLGTSLLAAVTAVRYTASVTDPIKEMAALMNSVAQGDLYVESVQRPNQEVAELSDHFNGMVENLKKLITGISDASGSVSTASLTLGALSAQTFASAENMLTSVEEIAEGTETQREDAYEGVQRIQLMGTSIHKIHSQTEGILAATHSTERVTLQGIEQLKELDVKSHESLRASQQIREEVAALNIQIERIGGIVEAISKIAKTTNLLSLNAAIEAARAGDAGRGFTVVAQEVRKLADQTTQEAADIHRILQEIQKKARSMENTVDQNALITAAQNTAVKGTEEAFSRISQEIGTMAAKVTLIAEAIAVLDQDKGEMIRSVGAIATVADQTAGAAQTARASTQEQFSSVEHLRSQAEDLDFLAAALMATIQVFQPHSLSAGKEPDLTLLPWIPENS